MFGGRYSKFLYAYTNQPEPKETGELRGLQRRERLVAGAVGWFVVYMCMVESAQRHEPVALFVYINHHDTIHIKNAPCVLEEVDVRVEAQHRGEAVLDLCRSCMCMVSVKDTRDVYMDEWKCVALLASVNDTCVCSSMCGPAMEVASLLLIVYVSCIEGQHTTLPLVGQTYTKASHDTRIKTIQNTKYNTLPIP